MTTKTFIKKFRKLIVSTGEFETDLIAMEEIKRDALAQGFDDIIYVANEDENRVFMVIIKAVEL